MPCVCHVHNRRIVILGGGIGGLTAGWILARLGLSVTIVEQAASCGGLAVTRRLGPCRYDLGPHNIHTRHLQLLEFLRLKFTGLHAHALSSRIIKNGRIIPYPIKGGRVLTSLAPARIPAAACSFAAARARMFFGDPTEDGSFQCWIVNRFGKALYREYFHDYPAKVWGIPPDEIDRSVAEKRIPVIGLTELVRAALLNREARVDHPEVTDANYYLSEGIGAWPAMLEAEYRAAGGRVCLERRPASCEANGATIESVTLESGESLPCDFLLSTIPVNDLISLCPKPTEEAFAAARSLDYCASVLLFIRVGRPRVLPASLLYFTAPDVRFSRASDFSFFSERMAPEGETILCLELPCSQGDANWNSEPAVLFDEAVALLERERMIVREDIVEYTVERITHAYPRFRKGYRTRLETCLRFVNGFSNLVTFGRQGGFSYSNLDSVSLMALHAAAAALTAPQLGLPAQAWYDTQTAPIA